MKPKMQCMNQYSNYFIKSIKFFSVFNQNHDTLIIKSFIENICSRLYLEVSSKFFCFQLVKDIKEKKSWTYVALGVILVICTDLFNTFNNFVIKDRQLNCIDTLLLRSLIQTLILYPAVKYYDYEIFPSKNRWSKRWCGFFLTLLFAGTSGN